MKNNKEPAVIELSVKTTDGKFNSTLRCPVDASKEQIEKVARAWFDAMWTAVEFVREGEEEEIQGGVNGGTIATDSSKLVIPEK